MNDIVDELKLAVERCKAAFVPKDRRLLEEPARHQGLDLTQAAIKLNDLARGFVLKIYTHIVQADDRWSLPEQKVGSYLIEQFWNRQLSGPELKAAWEHLMKASSDLKWEAILAPFMKYPSLQPLRMEIFTVGMHLANILAKSDGLVVPEETYFLFQLEKDLAGTLGISTSPHGSNPISSMPSSPDPPWLTPLEDDVDPVQLQNTALERLRSMIGLNDIKTQVEELTHFLEHQQRRVKLGLRTSTQSHHMVFLGNPGTGKTTVARILADIFRGLGLLKRGQLVETDRAGLVAEYAGQTAAKTSRMVDEALDGILFVDEAYSLIDTSTEDPFGREALQTLLKRMEDFRDRLIVIFAGYTEPTEQLLQANPGLPSRIGTRLSFPDYAPNELMAIYNNLCKEHQYQLTGPAAARVFRGLVWLHAQRNEQFGNARLVRNAFERTIRRMATRIVPVTPVTHELLTTIEAPDVCFPDIDPAVWETVSNSEVKVRFACPGCQRKIVAVDERLVQNILCAKCQQKLRIEKLSNFSISGSPNETV